MKRERSDDQIEQHERTRTSALRTLFATARLSFDPRHNHHQGRADTSILNVFLDILITHVYPHLDLEDLASLRLAHPNFWNSVGHHVAKRKEEEDRLREEKIREEIEEIRLLGQRLIERFKN